MKKFVKVIGYLTGICSLIAGLIIMIVGISVTKSVGAPEGVWLYILIGLLFIVDGVFICGLIWWISEGDRRLDRIEKEMNLPAIDAWEEKEEDYFQTSDGVWHLTTEGDEAYLPDEEDVEE